MPDMNHESLPFNPSEQEHRYSDNIHLLSQPFLQSLLGGLCDRQTMQPDVNWLVSHLYQGLAAVVLN